MDTLFLSKSLNKLSYFYFGFIIFLLSLPVLTTEAGSGDVLYQKGAYTFTKKSANELIELAEFIGRSKFTPKDKKALLAWSIQDFKSVPDKAVIYYKDLANNLMPKIRVMKNNTKTNNYRADLYLGYINLFNKHPEYKKLPDNFLAVIDRYNPPIQEALLLQQLQFNLFQQQLQMSQRVFNQTMKLQQQSSDRINKSIRDQATRYSITVPGGEILHETDTRIYAKDYKGRRFEISK